MCTNNYSIVALKGATIGGNPQIRVLLHGFATPLYGVTMGELIWIGLLAAISGLLTIAMIALYIV